MSVLLFLRAKRYPGSFGPGLSLYVRFTMKLLSVEACGYSLSKPSQNLSKALETLYPSDPTDLALFVAL